MKKFSVILVLALPLGSGPVSAGEGNGPDFPGLQIPNVGITANFAGRGGVSVAMSHRSDMGYDPPGGFASAVTPDGVVTPENFGPNAPWRHRQAGAPVMSAGR